MVLGLAIRVLRTGLRVHRFGTQGYGLVLMVEGRGFDVLGSGFLVYTPQVTIL